MTFDPYHQWLGIRDPARPPNHYRLLGIELFEADPDVIITAADRQMAHLRTFQHGQDSDVSQQLLNEVAAAKVCLLNAEKKAAYDERLRTAYSPQAPPAPAKKERTPAPELPQVTPSRSLELRPPGRSARQRRRRRRITALVLIPLIAAIAGYGLIQWQHQWTGQVHQTVDAEPAGETTADNTAGSNSQTPGQEASNAPSGDAVGNPAAVPNMGSTPPSEPPVTSVEPPPAAAVWDSPDLTIRKPPQFAETDPLRSFLLLVSRRDLPAAEAVLEEFQKGEARPNQPLQIPGIDRMTVAQAENVLFLIQRFWQAVDEAHSRLVAGVTLNYRQQPVTVSAVTPTSVVLQAANGEERPFDLRRSKILIDVAIALVEWRFADALPAAWRMIGCVLALDQEGDETRAQEYFQQAELHGFSTQQLVRFFERRDVMTTEQPDSSAVAGSTVASPSPVEGTDPADSGSKADSGSSMDDSASLDPPAATEASAAPDAVDASPARDLATSPNASYDASPNTSTDDSSTATRWAIPEPTAQSAVHQDVLLELRGEITQELTKQERAQRILQKAATAARDPIRYYVLLREALTKGMESGDIATTLAALDSLLARYEIQESTTLQLFVLESLERNLNQDAESLPIETEMAEHLARAWRRIVDNGTTTGKTREKVLERARYWGERASE